MTVLRWQIVGRFDPIPAAPAPTSPPPASEATFPGGIPSSVGGEPVLIGLDGRLRVAQATDATPFLVAGWYAGHGGVVCTGGIGPVGPEPARRARGCPRFDVVGLPGRPYYPQAITLPEVDGPIVLRVHTHDPGAETCWFVEACRQRLVVDAVAWSSDPSTFAAPFGPRAAIGQLLSIAFADQRPQADKSIAYVDEDIFTLPLACGPQWPTLFGIHGEPRLGLLAVFPDSAARAAFQSSIEPAAGAACLADPFPRHGDARWIARDNMLVLVFGDEATAAAIQKNLDLPVGNERKKPIPLPDASLDLSLETMWDFLAARAAGETDHATGDRLARPQGDEQIDTYGEWKADTLRRAAVNALQGTVTLLSDQPGESDVGPEHLGPACDRTALGSGSTGSTTRTQQNTALASETYLVIQDPASTFHDWMLLRVGGAAYPTVTVPPPVTLPLGVAVHRDRQRRLGR